MINGKDILAKLVSKMEENEEIDRAVRAAGNDDKFRQERQELRERYPVEMSLAHDTLQDMIDPEWARRLGHLINIFPESIVRFLKAGMLIQFRLLENEVSKVLDDRFSPKEDKKEEAI